MSDKSLRPKAYSYLRFSTSEQSKGDSTRRQKEAAEIYAANNNLDLDETLTFKDQGTSAFRSSNSNEGRLGEFLRLVKEGIIPNDSFLLVENLDRISRDVVRKATRTLEDIVEEGITVVTLNDNRCYNIETLDKDPTSFMLMVLCFQRAHEESIIKSARIREAWKNKRDKAKRGSLLTHKVPAWLKIESGKIKSIPERARVINWIFNQARSGKGASAIAHSLNEKNKPTWGRSDYWYSSYIKKILRNPAVIGTFVPHEIVHDPQANNAKKTRRIPLDPILHYYPSVIPTDLWKEVTRAPTTHFGKVGRSKPKTILAGLATCPLCEGRMHRVNKGSKSRPFIVCGKAKSKAGCSYKSIRLDQLEDSLITQILPTILSSPPAPSDSLEEELSENQNALEGIEELIYTVLENLSVQRSPALVQKLTQYEKEKEGLVATIRDLEDKRDSEIGPVVNKRIEKALSLLGENPLPIEELNLALRAVFKQIIIDYKEHRLRFVWHSGQESSELYLHEWPKG